ncbi:MAG: hypothetical protein C0501_16905 [Isosphaera sp.]|nr:hypothetical protein [Isosphaera sp.]
MRTKLLAAALLAAAVTATAADGPQKGTPDLKSATALAFGPNGVLFVGDSAATTVFAVETGDTKPAGTKDLNVEKLGSQIAAKLGATEQDISVTDVKVNPASGNVYVAVKRGTGAGQPAIIRVGRDGSVEPLGMKDVTFDKAVLPGQDKGKAQSFTSLGYADGKVFVAGLSSEDFASTLWAVPYPFKEVKGGTGIEIFHGAHGKLETKSPIRTFTPYKIGTQENIMASYTCTPLVRIPVSDLKPGAKVKGTTIAELGNGNQPLDMIPYTKDGKDYLLVTNTKRGVMKIPTAGFDKAEAITARPGKIPSGVPYETVASLQNVTQLDKLDDTRAVILVGGDLKTIALP